MSTRCQIEFRSSNVRRTVYRHWDGYPSAVIPDLLAFLAWSERRGDVEYESANFLYWSKRELGASEQLGFGICANDELHGDIEYYYVVRYDDGACTISAHDVESKDGAVRVGRVVAVAPAPFSFSSATFKRFAQRARRFEYCHASDKHFHDAEKRCCDAGGCGTASPGTVAR